MFAVLAASTIRGRVEATAHGTARVVREVLSDEVPLDQLRSVRKAGGRGKPSHIELKADAETAGWQLVLAGDGPRGFRHRRGNILLPILLTFTPGRVAEALGIPLLDYRSGMTDE